MDVFGIVVIGALRTLDVEDVIGADKSGASICNIVSIDASELVVVCKRVLSEGIDVTDDPELITMSQFTRNRGMITFIISLPPFFSLFRSVHWLVFSSLTEATTTRMFSAFCACHSSFYFIVRKYKTIGRKIVCSVLSEYGKFDEPEEY